MQLPERFQYRRFMDWNYLVKGLIEVWEIARILHMEAYLEQQLEEDVDGALTEWLGHLGNRQPLLWHLPSSAQNCRERGLHLQRLQDFFVCVAQDTRPEDTANAMHFLTQENASWLPSSSERETSTQKNAVTPASAEDIIGFYQLCKGRNAAPPGNRVTARGTNAI